jgi:Tol biopolymer transport system component
VRDTIEAKLGETLTVEITQGGKPKRCAGIEFQSLRTTDPHRLAEAAISVSHVRSGPYGPLVIDSTDASGRAGVYVQLGTVVGPAMVVVSCPSLALQDTAHFTVDAGAAARLIILSPDTLLSVGGTYTISSGLEDRFHNPAAGLISYSAGPNVVSIVPSGTVVVGQAIGRGAVAVRSGSLIDSSRFMVVPRVRIAFLLDSSTSPIEASRIAVSNLDGSSLKVLTDVTSTAYPSAAPGFGMIAFHQEERAGDAIYIVDASGARRRLLDSTQMRTSKYPRFSEDGTFVYFSGTAPDTLGESIWRVRTDGTALQRLAVFDKLRFALYVAPSPDGSRIAYSDGYEITIQSLLTGTRSTLAFRATFPVFSPDGRRLAFLADNSIMISDLDGSPPKSFGVGNFSPDAGLTWLPDGQWLLARSFTQPALVNAASGEQLNLPSLDRFFQFTAR